MQLSFSGIKKKFNSNLKVSFYEIYKIVNTGNELIKCLMECLTDEY